MTSLKDRASTRDPFRAYGLIDQIRDMLTEAILSGELPDGHRLKETDLQERFQVSRSPIREALRDLEKKGLVTIVPRRGAFVKTVTLRDIRQNFAVRSVLEGLAAREAHGRMTNEDLGDLKRLYGHMKQAARKKDSQAVMRAISLFHRTFILRSGNDAVINCLRNLPVHIMWKRFVRTYSPEEMQRAASRHERILNAFLDRKIDPAEVERVVRDHLTHSIERLSRYLEPEREPE